MLSSGTNGEPPVDTPLPTYYGYQLASLLTTPGSQLSPLPTASDSVLAYSSTTKAQRSVLLVNDDPSQSHTVPVAGLQRDGATLRSYTYSAASPSITSDTTTPSHAQGGLSLPPQSIVVLTPGS